jgi:hypothetical protein
MSMQDEQRRESTLMSVTGLGNDLVSAAIDTSDESGSDICEVLLEQRHISADQVDKIRQAILESHGALPVLSQSGNHISTGASPSGTPSSPTGVSSRYEIVNELSRGGMEIVYVAIHKKLSTLNVLRPLPAEPARLPNAFGLTDTLANVFEICADNWIALRNSSPTTERPRGAGGDTPYRVKRGGGFFYGGPIISRPSNRSAAKRDDSTWALGCRIVRSLVPDTQ